MSLTRDKIQKGGKYVEEDTNQQTIYTLYTEPIPGEDIVLFSIESGSPMDHPISEAEFLELFSVAPNASS